MGLTRSTIMSEELGELSHVQTWKEHPARRANDDDDMVYNARREAYVETRTQQVKCQMTCLHALSSKPAHKVYSIRVFVSHGCLYFYAITHNAPAAAPCVERTLRIHESKGASSPRESAQYVFSRRVVE
jgi:hypothetical protein